MATHRTGGRVLLDTFLGCVPTEATKSEFVQSVSDLEEPLGTLVYCRYIEIRNRRMRWTARTAV